MFLSIPALVREKEYLLIITKLLETRFEKLWKVYQRSRKAYKTQKMLVTPSEMTHNSFMFIFRCLALSWQDVVIALIGDKFEGFPQLQKFGFKIMTGIFSFLMIISFSPLGDMWFRNIAGLSDDLVQMSRTPLKILILVPCVSVMMSAYRAVAIKMEDTLRVTWATILEISTVPCNGTSTLTASIQKYEF